MPTDPALLSILVCPVTRTRLIYDEKAQELISDVAGLAYPIRNGIPIMLVTEARVINKEADTSLST
ncbi:MAG: Trm112 family protein [Pseudomonadota bacterium]